MKGQIDDLYSQFKGLSDRMTFVDSKVDHARNAISEELELVTAKIDDVTNRMKDFAKHSDLVSKRKHSFL